MWIATKGSGFAKYLGKNGIQAAFQNFKGKMMAG
jgi:hypothetical protein